MKYFNSSRYLSLQYIIPFPVLRGCSKPGIFYVKFESKPWQEMHGMNHKGLVDAVRRSSHPYHTSKEAFEILQQQWMSLLLTQYDISNADGVPQIWHFV